MVKRVIPCLDVQAGRVVKGTNFVGLKDAGDPVELASRYDREGADELVFLDITATNDGRKTMLDVVRRTAERVSIPFTVGGGISSVEDMHNLLEAGADKVSINSAAVREPELVTEGARHFGSRCVVVAIDARRRPTGESSAPRGQGGPNGPKWARPGTESWEVYTHGGRTATGMDAVEWAMDVERLGAGEILVTSMDADGTRRGYDVGLLKELTERLTIPVIASGGAGSLAHIRQALVEGGADAVLAASIFHYGSLTVEAVKQYLAAEGIPVRG